ncbi:M23 family metallopeptidase [Thalassovita taeanensis]|uniref:Peptidase family M23 n=1 Tax=Thalassovita taeanensis TaxID=657014 RepID=A0A1H9I480_9RHOB|nr:M23 family metallopeptidase [Thalassovita taeanensis]SEQ69347.1 Peptidase family M23 [Thalassovita taeanensis]
MFRSGFAVVLSLVTPAVAGEFQLSLPIDCTLGESCFIQQFVDHDPTAAAHDYTCGPLSYEGHKGTDFGLLSLASMEAGVNVLASADGIVVGLRDGMQDTGLTPQTEAAISGKDCGNGVVLGHGDGWQTQYCHMKQGSVQVHKGQRIRRGEVLGQVGLSGRTQFPHVHLSVRKDGAVVDPFAPDSAATCQPQVGPGLWQSAPEYHAGGVLNIGFSTDIPSYQAVKAGSAEQTNFSTNSPAIVLWVYAFGSQEGDELHLLVTGPSGPVIDKTALLDKAQAQYFRAAGRRKPTAGWPTGSYHATATLLRDGAEIDQMERSVVLK